MRDTCGKTVLGNKVQASFANQKRTLRRWHEICIPTLKGGAVLYYALMFLLVAMMAGALGFGAVAFAATEIARIVCFIFIVLFLVSLISQLFRRASRHS